MSKFLAILVYIVSVPFILVSVIGCIAVVAYFWEWIQGLKSSERVIKYICIYAATALFSCFCFYFLKNLGKKLYEVSALQQNVKEKLSSQNKDLGKS